MTARRPWKLRLSRDTILFALGIVIVVRVMVIPTPDSAVLLMLAAACLGLPLMLRANGH